MTEQTPKELADKLKAICDDCINWPIAHQEAYATIELLLSLAQASQARMDGEVAEHWTLIAPDGRQFQGDSPMRCARAELDTRVPVEVQLERIWAGVEEACEELMSPLARRAIDLHEKASMPWSQAYELALNEFGFNDDDLSELIGECGNGDDYLLNREAIEGFARAVLVWGPDYLPKAPLSEILAAPKQAAEAQAWRPIETAPKDGTHILIINITAKSPAADRVHWGEIFGVGHWRCGEPKDWTEYPEGASEILGYYETPTHWMPLPAAPDSASRAAEVGR